MIILDANYVLRFLLKDNSEMYIISRDCIINNDCTIPSEVLAEVVFILLKVYKVTKSDITEILVKFLNFKTILMDSKYIMIQSLEIFSHKI